MRRLLVGLSMLVMGCSADTFVGADGGPGSDGGGGGDGSASDAPFDVASCAPTWCTTQSTLAPGSFCEDFDDSDALPVDWGQEITNGTVTMSTSPAVQCLSMHAHLAQVGGTSGAARLIHTSNVTQTTSAHAVLTLEVSLPKTDAGGTVFYFVIRGGGVSIGLVQRADGTWWLQSSLGTNTLAAPLASQGPTRGAFTHMVLDVTYLVNQVNATLTYRRADGNSDSINANGAAITLQSSVSFIAGMAASTSTTTAVDAYYDDVITTLQ